MEPGAIRTESNLVERAITGDCAAFGELYTRYLDPIYRYVYYRVGDTHEAEDLTEIVFMKAWQAVPTYKDLGLKFSSWLYRIAHNVVVDFHRKRGAEARMEEPLEDTRGEKLPAALIKQMSEVEDASALAQAITRLTSDQQQIVLLRFIEGLTHAEIGRIMDKSAGACRMLQNRALVALYHELNGNEGDL